MFGFSIILNRRNKQISEPYSVVKLFSTLTARELRSIIAVLHDRTYIEGEVVFDEGEIGQAIYFVLDGTVSLRRTLPDGNRILARRRSRRQIVGLPSFSDPICTV